MRTIHKTLEPVVLEGYQAIFRPSKFGYSLMALVDQDMIDALDEDREDSLKWAYSKLKNPKRATLKPEPWEEVTDGKYKIKFSWKEDSKPPIVDTEGSPITDQNTPIYSGSTVKLAFYQKAYILKDQITYGTSLKLLGVQVVTAGGADFMDIGDLNTTEVAGLFGTTQGYKVGDPNIEVTSSTNEEDDF